MKLFAKIILAFVVVALLLLVMGGCVTYNKCLVKFGTLQKPTQVTAKGVLDSTLTGVVHADSTQGKTNADSLIEKIQRAAREAAEAWKNKHDKIKSKYDSMLFQFGDSKLKTQIWYDPTTHQVKGQTNKKADTVFIHLHDTVRVVADCPPVVVFDKEKAGPAKVWKDFQFFAAWFLLLELVVLIAILIYKFK